MVQSLESSEIDVGIGLTEGWAAGLAKAQKEKRTMPYRFVGTYVESPLCWAINKGKENTTISSMADLKGKKVGVSRIGSGSYVMSFVLADQQGWLQEPSSQSPSPFSEFVTLNNFKELRDGVNGGKADFFMWETFTSKRYHDSGEIAKVGEINTPWSSWMIVTRDPTDRRTEDLAEKLNHGISYFNEHRDEAVDYISTELDYSKEDADEWIKTVKFADDVRGVDPGVVKDTVDTLGKARVLDEGEVGEGLEMIGIKRTSRGR